MRKPISQREARRLRKEVDAWEKKEERRIGRWTTDYPGGMNIDTLNVNEISAAKFRTAAMLGFALVCKMSGDRMLVYAVKP